MLLMQYFCLHGILPFSKSFPEIESTWPTAKCKGRKSFDKLYYIITCATLCVNFSSKSNTINVFPKHILKSKARNQSIQARNKLFYHVIVDNYLCNLSWKFLIKIESTLRSEIKEQASQLTFMYRGRTVTSSHWRCCICVSDLKTRNFIKKRPQHRYFPVNIAEFLMLPILKNIYKRLPFNFFNASLLHGPKGLRYRLHDGVRLQGPSHRFSFCFYSGISRPEVSPNLHSKT